MQALTVYFAGSPSRQVRGLSAAITRLACGDLIHVATGNPEFVVSLNSKRVSAWPTDQFEQRYPHLRVRLDFALPFPERLDFSGLTRLSGMAAVIPHYMTFGRWPLNCVSLTQRIVASAGLTLSRRYLTPQGLHDALVPHAVRRHRFDGR